MLLIAVVFSVYPKTIRFIINIEIYRPILVEVYMAGGRNFDEIFS